MRRNARSASSAPHGRRHLAALKTTPPPPHRCASPSTHDTGTRASRLATPPCGGRRDTGFCRWLAPLQGRGGGRGFGGRGDGDGRGYGGRGDGCGRSCGRGFGGCGSGRGGGGRTLRGRGRGGGRGGGMKGGSKAAVVPHKHTGVFISKSKEDALCTKNMVPGESVYGEKRVSVQERANKIQSDLQELVKSLNEQCKRH